MKIIQNIITRHTPEALLFIAAAGGHYFKQQESEQVQNWIEDICNYCKYYENRHTNPTAAAGLSYLAKKLLLAKDKITNLIKSTGNLDQKLIYRCVLEAINFLLPEAQ